MVAEYDDRMQSAAPGPGEGDQLPVGGQNPHRTAHRRRRDVVVFQVLRCQRVAMHRPAEARLGQPDGLEVRQGWFAERNIRVGAQADIVFGMPGR